MIRVLMGYEDLADLFRLVAECLKRRNVVENLGVAFELCSLLKL